MKLKPNRLSSLVLAVSVAAVLGACGGGDALPPGATPLTAAPDKTPPTLAMSSSSAGATATGEVTFTFTFSENVGTSFTADDVVVIGGAKGAFATPSGTTATLVVVPNASSTGTLELSVAAARFSDLAGNLNAAATTLSQPLQHGGAGGLGQDRRLHRGALHRFQRRRHSGGVVWWPQCRRGQRPWRRHQQGAAYG